MVFTRILICSAFCFVFANCANNKLTRRQSYETIGNHEFENCSNKNFSKALKSNLNFYKCQPREAVVHLSSRELNVEVMVPNKVVVKRCYESGCYGMNSCLPSKTREVKIAVRLFYRVENKQKCSWVPVVEHTECKCGCKISREECTRMNKEFDPKDCTCKCKNEEDRKSCISQNNMMWDEETCSCTCATSDMECSTGAVWVPKYCKCMYMADDKIIYGTR